MASLATSDFSMCDKTYLGHCHCGAIQYEVTTDIQSVVECNCLICKAAGWQLSFVPAQQFELKAGEDSLVDYQFGKNHLHHPFCSQCRVRAFRRGENEDGQTMYAVNTRCRDGFDRSEVEINQFDGANLQVHCAQDFSNCSPTRRKT
jgi:hypothetical protein